MDDPFIVMANVDEITHEQWLELRRTGIGGSDAGGVLGMSRWSSPLSVWADKRGLLPEQPDNDDMEYGRRMEPTLRQWFIELMNSNGGDTLSAGEYPKMLRSTLYPWAIADLDGVVGCVKGMGGLELKTADRSMAKEWKEGELPDGYYCQIQHYNAVTGWPWFYVFCLLGKHPIIRYVPRNQPFIDDLMERERQLWEMIEANTMPAPSGLDCDDCVLSALYQGGGEDTVKVSQEIEEVMARHAALKESIDEWTEERKSLGQRIKLAMGNAKRGQGAAYHATWSRFKKHPLDIERLKREEPVIAAKYTKEEDGERFAVTENSKKEEKNQ
jgi:putative phage-type endonuclease